MPDVTGGEPTDFFAVIDRTWPARAQHRVAGFVLREGAGGGGRVSAASWCGTAPPDPAAIADATAMHRRLGQAPRFMVRRGEAALDAALAAAGFGIVDPTVILAAPLVRLADAAIPPVTAFPVWPPLAAMERLWEAGGIGAARQAVMARADVPKAAILGRADDRAAGIAYVALDGTTAMVHALHVAPAARRSGLGGWIMRRAAQWAAERGAERMALAVTAGNAPAQALYARLGFEEAGGYHYRLDPTAGGGS